MKNNYSYTLPNKYKNGNKGPTIIIVINEEKDVINNYRAASLDFMNVFEKFWHFQK